MLLQWGSILAQIKFLKLKIITVLMLNMKLAKTTIKLLAFEFFEIIIDLCHHRLALVLVVPVR